MEYYTYYYEIDVITENKSRIEEVFNFLKKNGGTYCGFNIDTPANYYYCIDSAEWYDCDMYMIELAKKFPDVTFILYGECEECDDIWEKTFHGDDPIKYVELWYVNLKHLG